MVLATVGGGELLLLVERDQGCYRKPYDAQGSLSAKNHPAPKANSMEVGKPSSKQIT